MENDFDGYRKWLGITNKNRLPTHYEVLAISLDEDDPEVIRAAVEQRRHYVESKRGEGHDAIVTEIIYRINEAESTLLNDEMRRNYDRQLNLFQKRHKDRQVDPLAPRSRIKSQSGRTVGEDSGIVKTFVGIMAVVCVGFGIMAWFSFQLPWAKKPEEIAGTVPLAQVQPAVEVPQIGDQPSLEKKPAEVDEPAESKPSQPSPDKPQVTFLATLPRIELRSHPKNWWSDKGELVLGGENGTPFNRKPLMFEGNPSPHGIYMSGLVSSEVFVKYRLDGRFEMFKSTVHVPEMLAEQGDPRAPLVFSVVGDGKTLWQSKALTKKGDHQPCVVSVNGVNVLSLKIDCQGPDNWALGAWIEPQVYGTGTGVNPSVVSAKAEPPQRSPDPHRLISGHTKEVNQLAISSDGKFLASASDDRTVRLWELETGKQVWKADWGNSRFRALAIESTGKRIWAANDSAVCVIDRENGRAQDVLSLKGKEQNAVAFGKNCSLFAACFGGKIRLYNTAQKRELKTHDGGGPMLAFNRDATVLATGGWEDAGDIQVLRVNDGKTSGSFPGLTDRTMALQISPDDKYVAAAGGCAKNKQVAPSNKVMVWEVATGRKMMTQPIEEGWCYGLCFSADGSLLAAGGCGRDSDWGGYSTPQNNKVRVWRIRDGKELKAFTGHTAVVQSLVFTPDGTNVVSSSVDNTIRIWSLDTSRLRVDREVAEWVLAKGGKVKVSQNGGEPSEIQTQGQLPNGDFNLIEVDLKDRKEVGDQDLRRLIDLRRLTVLTVMGTSVTDAGLRELADVTTLTSLNVAGTSITGSGFQHLSKLDKLETLLCGGAPITDANLVHLKKLPKLKDIGLIDTQVTDVGMPTIAALEQLKTLRLVGCKVTDKGLNRLMAMKSLEKLWLNRTGVSKKGVAAVRAALPRCEVSAD